jgi:molecular chaperone DnaK
MPETKQPSAPVAIGIDLGTTTSCICTCADGQPKVLPSDQGDRITPSMVAFTQDGSPLIGVAAKAYLPNDATNTIFSAKRLIGRLYNSEEVRKAKAVCPYEIVEGPNGDARVKVRGVDYSMQEISALILAEMKNIAEKRLGHSITQAVITVPAYFNDIQRQATKDAGRIAGLDVLRIINEPTAAALAYGYGLGLNKKIAVYDLGGGTFDISILEIGEEIFEVLATAGDTFLGGDDFDDRLLDHLADRFVADHGVNLRRDRTALQKLKTAVEKAKIDLSESEKVEVDIPELMEVEGVKKGISATITRADLARLTEDLVKRTLAVCEQALQSAGLLATDLDAVILVGGPTRLPLIREAVESFFGQPPQCHLDPEEVVATGAAIHASSLLETTDKAFLLDVTPLSLQLGISGGMTETIIEKNTPIPIEQTRTFTTLKDNQEEVTIRIYQGESRLAEENQLLGEFEFKGLRAAMRGELKIDVTFEINSEGIVNVTARDPETGLKQATTVRLSSGLTEEEILKATQSQASRGTGTTGGEKSEPRRRDGRRAPGSDRKESTDSQEELDVGLTPLQADEELTSPHDELDLLDGLEPIVSEEKDVDGDE